MTSYHRATLTPMRTPSRTLYAAATLLSLVLGVSCMGANQPPSIALVDDQPTYVGQQLSVPLEADPDGDALGWSVTGLGDRAEVIAQSTQSAASLEPRD